MTPRNPRPSQTPRRTGFTLVELIVVVVVVAVAATLGAPRLAEAESTDRGVRMNDALRELRRAVAVYAAQHGNVPPGHPEGNIARTPDAESLLAQLTGWTDASGRSSLHPHPVFRYGPYLRAIPVNVASDLSTVRFVAPGRSIDRPMDEAGWVYQPNTLTIVADTSGRDRRGVRYFDY